MVMLFVTGSDSLILRPVWMYLVSLRDVVVCDRCWYLVAPPSVFWRIGCWFGTLCTGFSELVRFFGKKFCAMMAGER